MQGLQRFAIRVFALTSKELAHIRRDSRTLALGLAMPVVLLVLFGFGVSFDLSAIPMAVVDLDRTEQSIDAWRTFAAPDEFRVVAQLDDPGQVEQMFRRREAVVGLVIPAGFARDIRRGEEAHLQLLLDGADGNTASQAIAKANAISLALNQKIRVKLGMVGAPPLNVKSMTRFNPEARSALFLVPGLVGYILAIVAVLLTALTVAREWERGSMEQLFATPVGRLEVILGKLLPYLGLGAVQLLMVLCVGAWVFEVPVRGSLPLLALCSLFFLFSMLGQGLLISVVTRNQMVATQLGVLSAMLPSMLLSGFLTPIDNMPIVLQWISRLVPAQYFVAALRGILLRGNGLSELWRETLALAVFSMAMVAASFFKFQRRLA
ncbi:ABC transporter permease [Stigmatella erecta]|uniref:ABC-2 type transport system permease protein n=1 Tax=Stigmatella erecta TaxID=83460 RepID=A0A1I0IJF7_9BACT|nr:ABC transporter permease [Stigmatella erecta]SET96866.1 ABC-2 type transport system permease protein [Stigmatella erecta]